MSYVNHLRRLPNELSLNILRKSRVQPVQSALNAAGARSLASHARRFPQYRLSRAALIEAGIHAARLYKMRYGHHGSAFPSQSNSANLYALYMNDFGSLEMQPRQRGSQLPRYPFTLNNRGHIQSSQEIPQHVKNKIRANLHKVFLELVPLHAQIIQRRFRKHLRKRKPITGEKRKRIRATNVANKKRIVK